MFFGTLSMFGGIDLGAANAKCVLMDANGVTLSKAACKTGASFASAAERVFADAIAALALSPGEAAGQRRAEIEAVCSTGYGRASTGLASLTRTEISCQALGCAHYFPGRALTIVDIGGQDTKVIRLDSTGARTDFRMNRKCAAGTGAFLEEMAHRLDIPLAEFDRMARTTSASAPISSFCTVFAATELIARIRTGESKESIIRGIFVSLVKRVRELDPLDGDVALTGGVVAYHAVVADLLSAEIGRRVLVPPDPQFTGALGAALVALKARGARGPE
ncbi:MAG: acyl-CoA dehydratase activase [Planctomycetota bacterium]|nr:acyl-CoA dehydratase activase [Planctomycetota bacterium]